MTWWSVVPFAAAAASFGSGFILGRHTIRRGNDREFLIYQVLFFLGSSGSIVAGVHMVNP